MKHVPAESASKNRRGCYACHCENAFLSDRAQTTVGATMLFPQNTRLCGLNFAKTSESPRISLRIHVSFAKRSTNHPCEDTYSSQASRKIARRSAHLPADTHFRCTRRAEPRGQLCVSQGKRVSVAQSSKGSKGQLCVSLKKRVVVAKSSRNLLENSRFCREELRGDYALPREKPFSPQRAQRNVGSAMHFPDRTRPDLIDLAKPHR